MSLNQERDLTISKKINISRCNFENDIKEATDFVMKRVETDEFQSGNTKLELHVDTLRRTYDIGLYRSCDAIHVWFDGNFAYELSLSSGGLKTYINQLFRNWRGVPGIQMIYHGDRCDPELAWSGIKANYREVEDYLYEDYIDGLKQDNKYDKYSKLKHSLQEKKFNDRLYQNYCRIVEIFLQLRDMNEQ